MLDLKKLVNYSLSQNAPNCILIMALYDIYGSDTTVSCPLSNNRTRKSSIFCMIHLLIP